MSVCLSRGSTQLHCAGSLGAAFSKSLGSLVTFRPVIISLQFTVIIIMLLTVAEIAYPKSSTAKVHLTYHFQKWYGKCHTAVMGGDALFFEFLMQSFVGKQRHEIHDVTAKSAYPEC